MAATSTVDGAVQLKSLHISMVFRYLFAGGTLGLALLVHQNLPFPSPDLPIVCAVYLIAAATLHLLTAWPPAIRLVFSASGWIDALLVPFMVQVTGVFVSPLFWIASVSALASSSLYGRRKSGGTPVLFVMLAGYVGVSIFQKYGILPNDVAYSATMMQNDLFFYLVVSSVVGTALIGNLLVRRSMNWRLSEMADAYRGVTQSCFSSVGTQFFPDLADRLAAATGADRAEVGWLDRDATLFSAEAVVDTMQPATVFAQRLQGSFHGLVADAGRLVDASVAGSWHFRAGARFDGPTRSVSGLLCLYFRKRPEHIEHVRQLLNLYAAGADAEAARREMEVDREKLEAQALYTQKMKAVGQLAGGIAHGFNNLLNSIIGYSELLERRLPDDPQLSRYAAGIRSSSRKAAELTAQLLTFARKGKYQVAQVDLNAIVRDVSLMLGHSFDKNVSVRLVLDAQESFVMGDRSQLENALLAMSMNARDAMPRGGELVFSTFVLSLSQDRPGQGNRPYVIPQGEYLVLKVKDTGVGMDEQTKRHLFEPFFTTKEVGKGTGLGLAAVFGCIKNHGGWIEAESALGLGTVFTIFLPRFREEKKRVPTESAELTINPAAASMRIVLVDDDDMVLETTSEALSDYGFDVRPFSRPDDALRYFELEHGAIDLVILDLMMPGMNGNELFTALRKIAPALRTVFVSGYSPESESGDLVRDEGVRYVAKPYSLKNLISAIRELVPDLA